MVASEPQNFVLLYREHFDAVLGFVTRRVGDPHTAADVTAEVFLAALGSITRYDPGRAAPRAWLFGIARNIIAAQGRRRATERAANSRAAGLRDLTTDDIEALEDRIDAERAAAAMMRHHAALPASLRDVLDLMTVDGLSTKEAAGVLGISSTAVRIRLHRARKALQTTATTPTNTTAPVMPASVTEMEPTR